jgi:hypothetical protein
VERSKRLTDKGYGGEHRLPDGLDEVARQLRERRPEATAVEHDRIKTRAMARAASSGRKGFNVRSRSLAVGLSFALMIGGTGGVIAGGGGGNSHRNSGKSEYKPGCGPKKSGGVNPSGTHTGPPGHGSCPKNSNKSNKGGSHNSHGNNGNSHNGSHNSH